MEEKKESYGEKFLEFWAVYPKRHRQDDKLLAWKCWQTRMKEKIDPDTLIACAREYCAEQRRLGKCGTEYVLSAKTFVGPHERWKPYLPKEEAPNTPVPVKTAKEKSSPEELRVDGRAFIRDLIQSLSKSKQSPVSNLRIADRD